MPFFILCINFGVLTAVGCTRLSINFCHIAWHHIPEDSNFQFTLPNGKMMLRPFLGAFYTEKNVDYIQIMKLLNIISINIVLYLLSCLRCTRLQKTIHLSASTAPSQT
jgi:hypothetical protein